MEKKCMTFRPFWRPKRVVKNLGKAVEESSGKPFLGIPDIEYYFPLMTYYFSWN